MSLEHYIQIREALIELADDFISLASTGNFFNHELLYPPEGVGEGPDVWSDEDFELLQRSFDGTSSWQEFRLSDDGGQCSRYWSINEHTGHIPLFEQLCGRGWQLLLAVTRQGSGQMPPGFCVDGIRPRVGVSGAAEWLALLHETAFRFPTVDLQGECRGQQIGDRQCVSNIIVGNSISASASLIYLVVNTDCAADLGSWECPLELELPEPANVPLWDAGAGELWFDDFLIKKFQKEAPNQRLALDAFQASAWASAIAQPFGSFDFLYYSHPAKRTAEDLCRDHITPDRIRFGTSKVGSQMTWHVINAD
ncbi:hypothetical protein [Fuerstiella marisgermanici]|uniref:Uncharacterized protein n=1 Tax=Fuerstiella marisgermanici TaxID=1891926 RepID=A0A1P8WGW9_9PLAN|nr:hypothetical protein [Fuerstiella marisgermanici]APZ93280.1 hypothetical protein Fuma_02897 [Fuerstiella marisgermanici]